MKTVNILIISLAIVLVSVTLTFAEAGGAYCTGVKVISAGAHTGAKVIAAKHNRTDCGTWPPNIPRWFFLDSTNPSNGNAMLAAALTAQTTGMTLVLVPKLPGMTEWSTLAQVYTQSN